MNFKKNPKTSLYRTPVRTLTPEAIALVSGGDDDGGYSQNDVGKPSSVLTDVQGFR